LTGSRDHKSEGLNRDLLSGTAGASDAAGPDSLLGRRGLAE